LEKNNPTKVLDNNSFYTIAEGTTILALANILIFGDKGQLLRQRIQ
jgi:hypothetical protein